MSVRSVGQISYLFLAAVFAASACGSLDAEEDHTAEVPTGTSLTIRLDQSISTRSNNVGMAISASTAEPVVYEGAPLVPAGSLVRGVITAISKDPPIFAAHFSEIEIDGQRYPLAGSVRGATMLTRSAMKDEGAKIGGGAAAGAVLGGVIGGNVKGAAIGAAAGAAAGTGVALATKDSWAILPRGAELPMRLNEPLLLPLEAPAPAAR